MQAQVDKRKLMEKLKKEKLAALRSNRPTGHDGWFEKLQIYLPKVCLQDFPFFILFSQQHVNCQTIVLKKRNFFVIQFLVSGFLSDKSSLISSEKIGQMTKSRLQSRAPKMLCFFAPLSIASLRVFFLFTEYSKI